MTVVVRISPDSETTLRKMTITQDSSARKSSNGVMSASCLEDKFEILKDIGDGSFGSVALARVRTAGAHVARRGSVVSSRWTQERTQAYNVKR